MTALIIYFSLAVVISFLCSLLEAVLLSISHTYIAILIEEGKRSGHILDKFKNKIDSPLSAILTINTVANTVGAAGVGAQALAVFGSKWVAAVSAILTFSILVFSEIIPKTIGAVYWRKLAPTAAYLITGLIYITFPFVIIFEALGRLIAGKDSQSKVTREEIDAVADMGIEEGELLDRERRVIKNILHLHQIYVRDVMTPRSVLFALPKNITVKEAISEHAPMRFSRIPVYGRDLDDISGIIRRYPLNLAFSEGKGDKALADLAGPINAVPGSMTVADVLEEFIQRREHLFLVVDEYGGTFGIITLEDAIETLLGVEIMDELDSVEDMRKYALEQWEKRKNGRSE